MPNINTKFDNNRPETGDLEDVMKGREWADGLGLQYFLRLRSGSKNNQVYCLRVSPPESTMRHY